MTDGLVSSTYVQTFTAPSDFTAVSFVLRNTTAVPITVTMVCAVTESVAVSKTIPYINGTAYPSRAAADSQLGFKDVTLNSATSIVIPAGTELMQTDFTPLRSVARTDGGKLPLVTVRM